MKTFEEAIAGVMVKAERHPDDRLSPDAKWRLDDLLSRYSEVIRDISQAKTTMQFVNLLNAAVTSGNVSLDSALLTVFINGIIIGMEMEKQ